MKIAFEHTIGAAAPIQAADRVLCESTMVAHSHRADGSCGLACRPRPMNLFRRVAFSGPGGHAGPMVAAAPGGDYDAYFAEYGPATWSSTM
jgi:hypothetical protein